MQIVKIIDQMIENIIKKFKRERPFLHKAAKQAETAKEKVPVKSNTSIKISSSIVPLT